MTRIRRFSDSPSSLPASPGTALLCPALLPKVLSLSSAHSGQAASHIKAILTIRFSPVPPLESKADPAVSAFVSEVCRMRYTLCTINISFREARCQAESGCSIELKGDRADCASPIYDRSASLRCDDRGQLWSGCVRTAACASLWRLLWRRFFPRCKLTV